MSRNATIALALLGVAIALVAVVVSGRVPPSPPPARVPPVSPYESSVAAAGIIEASTRNIEIAPPESGLVVDMFVTIDQPVEVGSPLFRIDGREWEAQLVEARAQVATAEAEINRLERLPRPETLDVLRAAVASAEAQSTDARTQYERAQEAARTGAASAEELSQRRYRYESLLAQLHEANARLALEEAGTWAPELAVAQALRDAARAKVTSLEQRLERLTVRSPIQGQVLKRNIEPGEYANALAEPALVIGDLTTLHVRARVDEGDTPRLILGAPAKARLRGMGESVIELKMLRIEPLATPKTDLTNMPSERVDTRVIEVVFEVTGAGDFTLHPGSLVDVFIDAAPQN